MMYYKYIDEMPLYNWRKCAKGEIQYSRKDLTKGNEKEDQEYWLLVYDDYLSTFGIGKEYQSILDLKKEIALLQCEFVISGDNFLRNEIRRLENELKELTEKKAEVDTDEILIHLGKWQGFRVDQKNTTVKEFFKLIEVFKKANTPKNGTRKG